MSSLGLRNALLGAITICGVGLLQAVSAQADTFQLTSCHISADPDPGLACPPAGTVFGTVTLTQNGTSVDFTVNLINGNRFVETGAGGGTLFAFNDSLAGSTITFPASGAATLNGNPTTITGGLSGLTGQPPIMADGTGTFTAQVFCTTESSCNGNSGIPVNDLHFTVTSATVAQLETANANGNVFVADVIFSGTGNTGPVDVSGVVPEPTTLLLVGTVLVGLGGAWRRRWSAKAAV